MFTPTSHHSDYIFRDGLSTPPRVLPRPTRPVLHTHSCTSPDFDFLPAVLQHPYPPVEMIELCTSSPIPAGDLIQIALGACMLLIMIIGLALKHARTSEGAYTARPRANASSPMHSIGRHRQALRIDTETAADSEFEETGGNTIAPATVALVSEIGRATASPYLWRWQPVPSVFGRGRQSLYEWINMQIVTGYQSWRK
ncbi:hypothetical protein BZA05DRAFT_411787 [Tricharina praecox]|uniref:uncharacterized protein n=1 Tax=Tricharina praecox TaxID=43433 RepID=UPI00221F0BFA|nr:uncharacterized protein BZA05DRAFT_411787 [Tricharina praecox]KAI5842760.1 hypothetical protein BZA05DRAFT_411787 [Tricharina praecox]